MVECRMEQKKILVIIPARGGSKGIPRKNIRLMNGKPLISYAIKCALESNYNPDVYVSTDDEEITEISEQYGAMIITRDELLSSDLVTLDPVVYDATVKVEQNKGIKYDYVITIQPTSPLLSTQTLDKAIAYAIHDNWETVISVVNHPRLSWTTNGHDIIPLYKERKNRQELPPQYFETGAFVISKRCVLRENSRIGRKISVYEVSDDEGIDIDNSNDWILAEGILKKKRIVFRADGYIELGLGHIYNCITMAAKLIGHDTIILTKENASVGIQKLNEVHAKYKTIRNENEIDAFIKEFKPDIWVNDCLNTSESYIKHLKKKVNRVVSVEDLGPGAGYADAVINALYEDDNGPNTFSGYRYVCLRDEFLTEKPKDFDEKVKNVVIMFGGTDPSNLNKMLYDILVSGNHDFGDIRFNFITGIGYDCEIHNVLSCPKKNIYVYPDVPRVTRFLKNADIAIIGQGRSIFEVACMGVPTIVLSQNEREMSHGFAQMDHGFINLGMGEQISPSVIVNTLEWLIMTPAIRKNMHDLMVKIPLREGGERVKDIILGKAEYEEQ